MCLFWHVKPQYFLSKALQEIYKKLSLEKTSFPSHTFVLKSLALTNQPSLKKD